MNNIITIFHRALEPDEALLNQLMKLIAISTISLYLVPYIALHDQGHWMVWDNLDSNYVWYSVLLGSGKLFSSNSEIILQPLGGIPRSTMPSEFDAFVWLYAIFGAEGAYIANRVIMTVVAFCGMHLLLSRHILKGAERDTVSVGVSLCYSILPFWPFGGLSVAGLPLALYAMLEIRQGNFRFSNWAILIVLPFYSSLILSGIFFLLTIFSIFIFDIVRRKGNLKLLLAISVMLLFYILSHYRLFIEFIFSSNFISHRSEFITTQASDLISGARRTVSLFMYGQGHTRSLQAFLILPLVATTALLMIPRSLADGQKILFWVIIASIGGIALFHGFQNVPPISTLVAQIKSLVPIGVDRFYFLSPMLWMLAFALSLSIFQHQSRSLTLFVISAVALQSAYALSHHELLRNRGTPNVNDFFAQSQFAEIQAHIGKPQNTYRVASIGIHPSIALFNGFYTLDGYWPNYPLPYKHSFREIISGEIVKDDSLRTYFDNWGSRAYLFNAQLGRNYNLMQGSQVVLQGLNYNWGAFYKMGGRYVLSAVEIDVSKNRSLAFERRFEDFNSAWDIRLYRVIPF